MIGVALYAVMAATTRSRTASALANAPRLGLGMASLGRPGYINLGHAADLPDDRDSVEAMKQHAKQVLDVAYELGIRYIDCARSYGESEAFVASWLNDQAPDVVASMVVGSKWGYEYTAGWRVQVEEGESHEVKKHTVAQYTRQIEETRSLLGEKLSLYQIHSATFESGVLESKEVLDALEGLRDAGVDVGASVSHPQLRPLEMATAAERGGAPLFSSVQATFNLLDQSAEESLKAAAEAGVWVIIKEALANGRLTSRAASTPALELLAAEAAKLDTTMDALALAWVLSKPWVGMVLSGASTGEMLRSNADAMRLAPLSDDLQQRLADAFCQEPEAYWADRRALAWQ